MFNSNRMCSLCDHLVVCKYEVELSNLLEHIKRIKQNTNCNIHGDVTCK